MNNVRLLRALCAQYSRLSRNVMCYDCGAKIGKYAFNLRGVRCWYVMMLNHYYLATYGLCTKCSDHVICDLRCDPTLCNVFAQIIAQHDCDSIEIHCINCDPMDMERFIFRAICREFETRANIRASEACCAKNHQRMCHYLRAATSFWNGQYSVGNRSIQFPRFVMHEGQFYSHCVPNIEQIRDEVYDAILRAEYCHICNVVICKAMSREICRWNPLKFMESIDYAWGMCITWI